MKIINKIHMKTFLFLFVILLSIFIGISLITEDLPCETLRKIADNPDKRILLIDKLTFFVSEPTYLSKFESVQNFPKLNKKYFTDFDLGINWEALNIKKNLTYITNFGLWNEKERLDFNNIKVEKIETITFGIGERSNLVFRLKHGKNLKEYKNWSIEKRLENFGVSVECQSGTYSSSQ